MTLYDINGAPHLIFKDIHAPAHCCYCGRLGDWLTSCRCGKDLHNMSDDDDYSAGQLAIHWDSDVDTTEFLETNEDTDEEEQGDEDEGVASVNNLNTTTTHYSQSSFNLRHPLLFWWLIYISFHSLTSVFNWLKTIFELILAWSWNKTSVLVMTLTALLWDTAYYYLDPKAPTTPYLSRSIKRKLKRTNLVPLRSYHKSWMLLSSFMLFFRGVDLHPALKATSVILDTASRINKLHDLIEITPMTHVYYSSFRLDEMLTLNSSLNLEETSQINPPESDDHNDSNLCHPANYFDAYSTQQELNQHITTLDYSLCLEPSLSDTLFDLSDLNQPNRHIYSYIHQIDDLSTPNSSVLRIKPNAYTALQPPTLGNVDLYPIENMPASFPVIVDSGASLAISPCKKDFVGAIHHYNTDKHLGGMAGGMLIKGIGRVAWSFKTQEGILTVHSKCYFVPNATARLLSPQRLYCAANNINGSFNCSETHAALQFTDVGELIIDYDPNNHLPIAIAKNLSGTQSQINLAILDKSNQNLTSAQKLLLLWHSKFGHKGFGSLQRIFRSYPFTSDRFKGASKCDIPRCEV